MEEGFLRLSRRFFSNEMWKVAREFSECEAWLDLIQSARFDATDEAYSELIGGREISYTRGQYPASISFLMKRWKWSEKKVRYFLSKLKKKGMITTCNQQGMTVITLCNYDDYNPIKDKPKDNGKGIDNNKEINDLKMSMGELRAELRAMSQKMDDKIEDLGQGRGNKKKKDKEIQLFGSDYYWTAKDAGAMSQLLQKLKFQREQKQMDVAEDSILYALQYLLSSIKEGWIFENFSVTNINSKFNEIVSQAKKKAYSKTDIGVVLKDNSTEKYKDKGW